MIGSEKVSLKVRGLEWMNLRDLPTETWTCGYCGDKVASAKGWYAKSPGSGDDPKSTRWTYARVCPSCDGPTLFPYQGGRYPGSAPGQEVTNTPTDLAALYNEARLSAAATAYTAAVLACRKILMHVAVERGADEGKNFVYYVEQLKAMGYVPPGSEGWVDYIRKRGNEANHEIQGMSEDDAIALVKFVEMLLRLIYEFPNMVPSAGEQEASVQADVVA